MHSKLKLVIEDESFSSATNKAIEFLIWNKYLKMSMHFPIIYTVHLVAKIAALSKLWTVFINKYCKHPETNFASGQIYIKARQSIVVQDFK